MNTDFAAWLAAGIGSEMFAGGVALGAMGMALAMLGLLWRKAHGMLLRRICAVAVIDTRSEAWGHFAAWLELSGALARARRLQAAERGRDPAAPDWILAPGRHVVWHAGRPCVIDCEAPGKGPVGRGARTMQTVTLTVPFARPALLRGWMEDGAAALAARRAPRIHALCGDWWSDLGPLPPRGMETLVCDDDRIERLREDLARFHAARDWYARRGAPWRRGVLLWGPPGTGKSSTIRALATALGRDLALIDVARPSLCDDDLREAMAAAPAGAFLVMEDVDAAFRGREARAAGVTLSGLLNAIDGVAAQEGRALFLTANHPERLDPALVRPGRVDVKLELGAVGAAAAARCYLRFFPGEAEHAARLAAGLGAARLTPAAIQGWLMEHAAEPERAADARGLLARAAAALPAPAIAAE